MITRSNKKVKARVPTPSDTIPVMDYSVSKGKVMKVSPKFYGDVELNPFNSHSPLHSKIPYGYRGQMAYLYSNRTFEYDFAETNRIVDTEAFVATIFRKKKSLILRNEPQLKSKSERNADYIQKRLAEMEYVSGTLFGDLIETIVESLVMYNNVFILIHRNEFSSSGLFRDKKKPIASLFVLSPTRLHPIEDDNGDVIAYAYKNKKGITAQEPLILKKEEIYHLYTDKKIDVSVGTPPLEAVKDDIQSLRQMEESMENLVYKHSSPLLHVKVGTDDHPAGRLPDGTSEIDYYNHLAQTMDNEGGLTTSHRVGVSLIGAESHALRAEPIIQYFKQRVVSGLKASLLDLGEADSISTAGANAVSKVLKQDVEAYQKLLERFFTTKVFNDLLLESKWYIDKARVPKDEEVEFKLLDADIEDKIKVESHLANLVRYGLMSPQSFSKETGRELPEIVLTNEQISSNISSTPSTGAFSTITNPQNQHSTDKEYEVLDSLIKSPKDKRFAKIYYYVQDSLSNYLNEEEILDLTDNLNSAVNRYESKGIEHDIINMSLRDIIINKVLPSES